MFDLEVFIPVDITTLEQPVIITTTMKLKRKLKALDGSVDKVKARECARGDQYKKRTYEIVNASSPTVADSTLMLVYQIAIILDLIIRVTADTVSA